MRIVCTGLLLDTCKQVTELKNIFKSEGFTPPILLTKYKTLPGKGGEGGRSDVILEVADKDISRLAVHPWHLNGLFHWYDDYYANNSIIVPAESKKYFEKETKGGT